jgi:hypothetical protein
MTKKFKMVGIRVEKSIREMIITTVEEYLNKVRYKLIWL